MWRLTCRSIKVSTPLSIVKIAGVWVPRTQASFECFAQNARSAQSFRQRLVQPSAKSASAATVVVTVLRGRGQRQRFRINTR